MYNGVLEEYALRLMNQLFAQSFRARDVHQMFVWKDSLQSWLGIYSSFE